MEEEEQVPVPVAVDPRFVRYFGLQVWQRLQEKEYFEQRKKYREWWWNHTVVLAWKCLTWTHAALLFAGTLSLAKALFWIRVDWLLLSVAAQSTCALGLTVHHYCNVSASPDPHFLYPHMCPANLTFPLSRRVLNLVMYDPQYYYTWVPEFLEFTVVGPFLMIANYYRVLTLPWIQRWPWLQFLGFFCTE